MERKNVADFESLSEYFPDRWEDAATDFGIQFGTRTGAKLENIGELLQIFFNQVAYNLSLESAAAWAAAMGLPAISGVALHKRVKKLGPYLAWMLGEMLETSNAFRAERWGGYEIRVVDGTNIVRPGDDRTTARIVYSMRLSDLRITELLVSNEKKGETFSRFEDVHRDQLYVADRGYSSPPGIVAICAAGADVLVRYNFGSLPLFDRNKKPFPVLDKLSRVSATRPREWAVQIRSGKEWLPMRFIAQKLPADQARKAREKLRKEKKNPSRNAIKAAGYRMIATTAPAARLPVSSGLKLYKLRWQIELQIKRDKSIIGLSCLPNFLLETIESWLYAKLILAYLTRRIADQAIGDLPPCAVRVNEAKAA